MDRQNELIDSTPSKFSDLGACLATWAHRLSSLDVVIAPIPGMQCCGTEATTHLSIAAACPTMEAVQVTRWLFMSGSSGS